MKSLFSRFLLLAKRWAWLVILGVVICSVSVYIVSKRVQPVYQATVILYVNFHSTSPYENTSAALAVLPTYAQFISNPVILNPVIEQHKGLTLADLTAMLTAKTISNTQNIELDVQNSNPQLAMQLANQVSQSFAQYSNTQLAGGTVQIFPAVLPTTPNRPKPTQDALIGALVGLGLSLALIVLFEWFDDRCTSLEEIQQLLEIEHLAIIPKLSRRQRRKSVEEIPMLAEDCRLLCASVSALQLRRPFKLLMISSAVPNEGKSTVAANLASFLATAGKRVLLVDADLRRPVLDQHFQLNNYSGLSSVLLEGWDQTETKLNGQSTNIPNLRVLTAGIATSNPAEMLQFPLLRKLFNHFNEMSQFDYIIFDTPPLLPVSDAQMLALYVPATLLVVDASTTDKKALLRAKRVLSQTGTSILGTVINKSPWLEDDAIRQYLSDVVHHPKQGITSMPVLPETPKTPVGALRSVNGVEDEANKTMILPQNKSTKAKQ